MNPRFQWRENIFYKGQPVLEEHYHSEHQGRQRYAKQLALYERGRRLRNQYYRAMSNDQFEREANRGRYKRVEQRHASACEQVEQQV
jgi:hypothetical protein